MQKWRRSDKSFGRNSSSGSAGLKKQVNMGLKKFDVSWKFFSVISQHQLINPGWNMVWKLLFVSFKNKIIFVKIKKNHIVQGFFFFAIQQLLWIWFYWVTKVVFEKTFIAWDIIPVGTSTRGTWTLDLWALSQAFYQPSHFVLWTSAINFTSLTFDQNWFSIFLYLTKCLNLFLKSINI